MLMRVGGVCRDRGGPCKVRFALFVFLFTSCWSLSWSRSVSYLNIVVKTQDLVFKVLKAGFSSSFCLF